MRMVFGLALTMVLFVLVAVVALFMKPVFLYFFKKLSQLLCSDVWFIVEGLGLRFMFRG